MKVKWSRDDCVRDEGDRDEWLMNPKCKICPEIMFVDGYPQVMMWKFHHKGSSNMMIHPCLW